MVQAALHKLELQKPAGLCWRSTGCRRGELSTGVSLRTRGWTLPLGTASWLIPLHEEPALLPHAGLV